MKIAFAAYNAYLKYFARKAKSEVLKKITAESLASSQTIAILIKAVPWKNKIRKLKALRIS